MKQGLDIAIPLTGRLILVLAPEDLTLGLPLHTNLTTAVYRTPSSWSHHTIDITFERLGTENFLFMVETYRGSDRLTFKYDYMGRRVEKCVYSGNILTSRTLFVYDGFKCVEELDALNNSVVSLRHAWQPFDAGLDVILATADGNATSFFLHDANKNVMQRTDAEGDLLEKYEYAPFGGNTGEARASIGFSSEAFDAATDLDYYNYRYYAPGLGRWTKRDMIGEIAGENLFSFCNNSSISFTDKLGYFFNKECTKDEGEEIGEWYVEGIEAMDKNDYAGGFGGSTSLGIKVHYIRYVSHVYTCTCRCPRRNRKKTREFVYEIEKKLDFSELGWVLWRSILPPSPWSPVPISTSKYGLLGNTVAQYMDVLKILEPEDIPFVGKHILSNLPHFKEKGNLVNDTGIPSIFCIVN